MNSYLLTSSWLMVISVSQCSHVTLLKEQFCSCDSSWLYGSTASHPLLGHVTARKTHTSMWFCKGGRREGERRKEEGKEEEERKGEGMEEEEKKGEGMEEEERKGEGMEEEW